MLSSTTRALSRRLFCSFSVLRNCCSVATIPQQRFFSTSTDSTALQTQVPNELSLKFRRRELLNTLDNEITALNDPDLSQDLTDYVKEQKFRLTCNEDGEVTIKKTVDHYHMTIHWDVEIDEELNREMTAHEAQHEHEEEMMKQQQRENEVAEENYEDDEADSNEQSDDEYRAPWHAFTIDLRLSEKSNQHQHQTDAISFMRLNCLANSKGQLEIRSLCFDENIIQDEPTGSEQLDMMEMGLREQETAHRTLDTDELSDATYQQLEQFMESLGVDEKFPEFVQGYSELIRTKQLQDKLGTFKQFLSK